ncbi:DUF7124 domain-containing protein [Halobacterium litoreum]|uniref:DUF7124 domain-containing protein n=1 Tax=Halobacterium litoreum TaxID=2039234 RepID=A0ABD5NDY1_9EURY|nr:hypothetical protein [Halobacterium litoreum]UHH13864.1 hypothetical protein LT972_02435 [Halobacterium litoreum]
MNQSGGSTDMTLAFELSALRELAKPGTAFAGARQWTEYVGVVSDEPTYVVTNFTRKRRIRQDFFSGPKGKEESLESVKGQFDTERHVFVGTSDEDRELAEAVDWEYLPLEDAAEAADWELAEDADEEQATEEPVRDDWP